MLSETISAALYPEWLAHVQTPEARDAFVFLVGYGATLKRYTCYVQRKGVVRDFRFKSADGKLPYAFIVNRKWLLFYFRLPNLGPGGFSPKSIVKSFPEAKLNRRGEWTVKLHDVEDVRRLLRSTASMKAPPSLPSSIPGTGSGGHPHSGVPSQARRRHSARAPSQCRNGNGAGDLWKRPPSC
jgi:hypothetical protein